MADYNIEDSFRAIENELMASMIRNMKRHRAEETDMDMNWSMWQAEQLKALEKYKKENAGKFTSQFSDIHKQIEMLIWQSRQDGGMDQEAKILQAIKNGFKAKKISKGTSGKFFRLNTRKLEALIEATQNDLQKAERAMLRMSNDQYRKVIYNAQVYANTGAGTYEQAVDMATKDFMSRGINCIEYANGARHTISEYAAMAIQTASKRAYLTGEGEKREEWGIHTVIMNKRGNACPLCLPFVGKVLIDDVWSGGSSKDGQYMLMSTAMSAGLYHPRCKDSHSTYFPGISSEGASYTKDDLKQIKDGYVAEQKQQYAKRQADKFTRLADNSLDEANKKKYETKKKEWKERYLSLKYPMNQGIFNTYNNNQLQVIKPHNIMKDMRKSEIGKTVLDFLEKTDTQVSLLYGIDNPEGLSGAYDPFEDAIKIYADTTKTVKETTVTVIHEGTHKMLGANNTKKEEVRCFINEVLHSKGKLTNEDVRRIIKHVNTSAVYKRLKWR